MGCPPSRGRHPSPRPQLEANRARHHSHRSSRADSRPPRSVGELARASALCEWLSAQWPRVVRLDNHNATVGRERAGPPARSGSGCGLTPGGKCAKRESRILACWSESPGHMEARAAATAERTAFSHDLLLVKKTYHDNDMFVISTLLMWIRRWQIQYFPFVTQ